MNRAERRRPAGTWAPAIDFLRQALQAPFADGELRMVTLPAALSRPETLLGLSDAGPAVFWAGQGESPAMAGLGAAHTITAVGSERFERVRDEAERLWRRIRFILHPEAMIRRPRIFGGFAFLPGHAPGSDPWEEFDDARFILPRLLYSADAAGPSLAVILSAEDAAAPGETLSRVERALEVLRAGDSTAATAATAGSADSAAREDLMGALQETTDARAWATAVESILHRIRSGAAEKIVAARRTVLRLDTRPDMVTILDRLGRENAAEARFAIRFGAGTLLGATPERLVSRRGDTVLTEALAGSIGAGGGAGAGAQGERLRSSAKEGEEHALVVRAIATALDAVCDRLEYPDTPDVRRLRHVLHLRTPFHGRLAEPLHVLDLVKRLHPTPAVGGTPTRAALDWIGRHEPVDRGWYAAPVGWFDDRGDGDFVVALRSGLLHHDRAYLYAGAGIVRDSDADAEFAETETKLRTMMDALGIAT